MFGGGSARNLILNFDANTSGLKAAGGKVRAEASGMAGDIGAAGEKGGKRFGKGIGAIGGVLKKVAGPIAAVFAVDKIKDFGVSSVNAASDLRETMSKSSAIFGKNAKAIDTWSNNAAKSFGLSKSEAMAAAAGFGDMFLQLGFTGKEATKSSKSVVQMAADLGSFNNLETGDVLDRISAAMRGEYDSLQAVIPNISAARVEKEALAATGKKSAAQLTAEEKAHATLAIVQKDGARAMGDFAKTSGGFANQQKILTAQFEDLKAKIGGAFLPIATKAVSLLNKGMGPATQFVTAGFSKLSKFAGRVRDSFTTTNGATSRLGKGLGVLRAGFGTVAAAGSKLFKAVAPIVKQIAGKLFSSIKKNMPAIQTGLSDLAETLGVVFKLIGTYYSRVAAVVKKVWSVIGPTVLKILGNLIDAIVGILGGLIKVVGGILKVLVGIFTGNGKMIKQGFSQIFKGLVKIVKSLVTMMYKNVRAIIEPMVKWVIKRITNLKNGIVSRFKQLGTWINSTFRKTWAKVREVFTRPVRLALGALRKLLDRIKSGFVIIKNWAVGGFRKSWARVRDVLTTPVTRGRAAIAGQIRRVKSTFSNVRSWASGTFRKGWSRVQEWLTAPVRKGRDAIVKIAGRIKSVFGGLPSAIGRMLGKMGSAMAKPINAVIRVLNEKLIKGGINALLAKVAGREWMTKNGVAHIPLLRFATGGGVGPAWRQQRGRIRGPGGPRADKVPLLGSAGEHMWSAVEVAKAGGHAAMEKMRAAARSGKLAMHGRLQQLAGGGPVQPVPGPGNRHTSGYPWATWAGDFPVSYGTPVRAWKDGVVAMVKRLTYSYGQHLRMNHTDGSSSLYAHMSQILGRVGQRLDAGQMLGRVGSTGNSTGPHLHFETMGKPYSGGSGGGLGDKIGDAIGSVKDFLGGLGPIEWIKKKIGNVGRGTGVVADALTHLPQLVLANGKDWITEQISKIGLFSDSSSWTGSKVGNWSSDQLNNASTIISVANRLGFGQKGALIGLITAIQESTLRNLGWGDRDSVGLFQQRAPWGSRADRMNPAKSASMFYLGGQGGQPGLKSKPWRSMSPGAAAQAVQVSAFPGLYAPHIPKALALLGKYKTLDTGGRLPTGHSLIYNGTGSEELVLNPAQERAMFASNRSGQAPTIIHIHVDGTMNDDRTIGKLITEIERYQRRRGPVRLVRNT